MAEDKATENASSADIVAHAAAEASTPGADTESAYECPFCVMMRKGGCETVFKAFMECGEKSDKGQQEMADCLPQFEALHLCMEKNKAVFDGLLQEMQQEGDHTETAAALDDQASGQQQQQQQQANMEVTGRSSSSSRSGSSSPRASPGSVPQVPAARAEESGPAGVVGSQSPIHDSIPLEGMAAAS